MGLFKRSPPKDSTSDNAQIQIPNGWGVLQGTGRPVPLHGNGHQKNLSRLSTHASVVPVRLKYDVSDRTELSIHSTIGWLADVNEHVRPQWRKRADQSAQEKLIIIGSCQIFKLSDGSFGMRVFLNRPDEIAVDLTGIDSKALSDSQIEKSLTALSDLEDLDPESVAGVRSQAKKAVKLVVALYQHALSLDETASANKARLAKLCLEFIQESESFADYDESQLDFSEFADQLRDCISHIPSDFEVREKKKISEDLNTSTLLNGKSIVLSGDFRSFSREEGEIAIKARGGKAPTSVTKKTFALVCGEAPGWKKIETATQLGIRQIDEAQFLSLLDIGDLS